MATNGSAESSRSGSRTRNRGRTPRTSILPGALPRRVEWTERIAVGIPAIDEQHRELYRKLDAFLLALAEHRSPREVETLVAYLSDYVRDHFSSEEEMMVRTEFPGLTSHQEEHAAFRDECARAAERLRLSGADHGMGLDVAAFVTDWLERHIEVTDRAFGTYLSRYRSKRTFEPRFVEVKSVRVLRLDFSGLSPRELIEAFARAGRLIASQPEASLRILTIFDSVFDEAAAEALKPFVEGNRPFVAASAVVTTGFWRVVLTSVKLNRRRDLQLFADEAAALEWLVRS